jgi:hypothetical protein
MRFADDWIYSDYDQMLRYAKQEVSQRHGILVCSWKTGATAGVET